MQLYIGNKNYSSWSLRPWLLMKHMGIDFEEVALRFDFAEGSAFRRTLAGLAPTSKVPVLVDDGLAVWDTLAIAEYLAERFPARNLWPADARARARARSLCAEMHAGFAALREHCPMNVEAHLPAVGERLLREVPGVARDLARLVAMWGEQLQAHGGPFLFGAFGIIDAYYAPVCLRIRGYGLPLPEPSSAPRPAEAVRPPSGSSKVAEPDFLVSAYVARVLELPAMREWIAAALAEHDFVAEDEPYRSQA